VEDSKWIGYDEQQTGKKPLYIFPLHSYYYDMKVAEKDSAVSGILEEEYRRSRDVLTALSKKLSRYPKGSLNVRKKTYKRKEYAYHYLVARQQGRVVNRHIPKPELPGLKRQLEERDKCRKEIQAYRKRIAYLEKLLQLPRSRGEIKK
jgi:hypothetical protein